MNVLLEDFALLTEAATAPQFLLQTKLYQPQPTDELIIRPQLITHLNQHLPRKLTLITAPAGYGKTTIATQWLTQLGKTQPPHAAPAIAWLSLDEYDDELLLFLRYFVAAIQTVDPDFGRNILNVLQGTELPAVRRLADLLANDLAYLAQPLTLTLDDYHVITDAAIHELLDRLLVHLPPMVHLLLLSRAEPPLAVGRLRVRRQMRELHASDLAFSLPETRQFMAQTLGQELQPETLQTLHAGSEGWIAGLQLTALSLPERIDKAQRVDETLLSRHVQDNSAYLTDYLFEEVLTRQPRAIQVFLMQTAILDRFCAPLCEAVLGQAWIGQIEEDDQLPQQIASSQAPMQMILRWLRRTNLFLVPLDGDGTWYRYHHLFQQMLEQMLREQMRATDIDLLHRRASGWLAEKGVTESAIRHALAANDAKLAARLIEQQRHHLLSLHDFRTLDRWLSWLPTDVVAQRPALLLAQGWRNYFLSCARSTCFDVAQQAEIQLNAPNFTWGDVELDEAEQQVLLSEINVLKAFGLPLHSHVEEIDECIKSALTQIPEGFTFVYPYLVMMKANTLNDRGMVADAHAYLKQMRHTLPRSSSAVSAVPMMASIFHFNNGDLHQSAQGFEHLLNTEELSDHSPFIRSHAHAYLGSIYYEWNQLGKAFPHLTAMAEIAHGYSLSAIKRGGIMLAALYQARAQADEARRAIISLYELNIAKEENSDFLNEVQSFHANLLLRQGALAQALQQFQVVRPEPFYPLDTPTEVPQLTEAQLLIAQGDESNLAQAREILQSLKATTGPIHHRRRRIHVLALEALLYQAAQQPQDALTTLQEALALAKPDRFVRTFADLGPHMAVLLEALRLRGFECKYVEQILAAFSTIDVAASPALIAPHHSGAPATQLTQRRQSQTETELDNPALNHPALNVAEVIEPLSERELDVLVLLAERLSNREIAQALNVSPYTVKNHLSTIYQKLGASGRRQAVRKAERAGLLPE